MRPQPDLPRRPSRRDRRNGGERRSRLAGRGRLIVGLALVALFIVLISLRGVASFYTDYLWFDSLHLSAVWRRVLLTKTTLTLIGAVLFFGLCWSNLLIAERLAPVFRPTTGEDDLIERYHAMVGRRAWLVRSGVSAFLALIVGLSLGSAWNEWILFSHRVDFGQKDATFHTDIGFYVFQLPFLNTVAGWLFSALLLTLFVTLLAHVVNGGIRFNTQLDRVTPQVKAHISVLLGVLALVQTGRYWLDRYRLTFSSRGVVDGATYTAVNVEVRALYLLMAISLFAFALFIVNIRRRGWVLPGMAVGLWILVAVLAGGLVPAFVQRFRVDPNKIALDGKYVGNNIQATQQAYGLSSVETTKYDWRKSLDSADLEANAGTLANVRLWDPTEVQKSFTKQQRSKSFYEINDVDVDRYDLNGKQTQVMIAARDLSQAGVPNSSWDATHLAYTHGYGVVASAANAKTGSGDPALVAEDIPVKTSSDLPQVSNKRSGIYFGENKSGYVIVGSKRPEIDYQDSSNKNVTTTYKGADGVRIGSGAKGFMRKLAFALRFGDPNPLLSSNVTSKSKVLLERDVTARAKSVAPFLAYDHDPYMVLVDGKLQYVLDAYTTTDNFPNAQQADTTGVDSGSGLRGRSFNYARNSVKAVIDAYDGTVTLYVVDPKDPIIRAYEKAFPELFTKVSEAPKVLREHFRYPEDLFTVQTQMWAKYHVSDPTDFLNQNDQWAVPDKSGEASTASSNDTTTGTTTGTTTSGSDQSSANGPEQTDSATGKYESQYLLMALPGEKNESFVLLRPYVSSTSDSKDKETSQDQMRSFIVANSDPDHYGEIKSYVLPATDLPAGPTRASEDIQGDEAVASQFRALCNQNTCSFAAPSILPIGDALLYVQSFFVAGGSTGAPKLEQVIVSYQRANDPKVAIATNLRDALAKIFGEDIPAGIEHTGSTAAGSDAGDSGDTGSKGTVAQRESVLIDKIVSAFDGADDALKDGDLEAYGKKIKLAEKYAGQLQKLRDDNPTTTPDAGTSNDESTTTTTDPKDASGSGTTTTPSTTTKPDVTTTTSTGT